jgi:RNA polymerase sigma-70 factor (ECF subfamily)
MSFVFLQLAAISVKESRDEPSDRASADASTDTSLLRRVQDDDQTAWRHLIQLYKPLVLAWARRCGVPKSTEDDIGQEVFQAVALQIGELRRNRPGDSFRGWLYSITRNKVRDHWRRHEKTPQGGGGTTIQQWFKELPDEYGQDNNQSNKDFHSVLRRALGLVRAEFTEKSWAAFSQVVLDGRQAADVAADLKITNGATYIAKSRILKRLREELEGLEDLDS